MFFSKDKEIGTNLVGVITPLAINQKEQIEEFLLFRQFSEVEASRSRFCLMILNLAHAIWWVNLLESNTNRAKRIIDSMVETFIGAFERNQEPIRIGDLIVDPLEIALINNKMGQIGIGKNTMTSYGTIMPIIYNKRVGEYFSAFKEIKVVLEKEGKSGFSPSLFESLAKYFVRHFTGESWEKYANFVADLSPFLTSWDMLISNIVEEYIKPERKQESVADSEFKNREEYEAWKCRKIKENEEKRQQSLSDEESSINYYYQILGLKLNASKEEVEQAYKDLLTVWNPEEFADEPGLQQKAREKVKEIDEAYKKLILYLSDPHKQITRIQPDDVDGYYNLGVKYEKLDMYEEAIEAYKRAIMIKPDYAKANYGLGVAYLYSGQKSKALEQYQKLKKLNPNLAEELFKQIYK